MPPTLQVPTEQIWAQMENSSIKPHVFPVTHKMQLTQWKDLTIWSPIMNQVPNGFIIETDTLLTDYANALHEKCWAFA